MPLSKKRQDQKERRNRLKTVIPKTGIVIPSDGDIIKAIETLDNAPVPTDNRLIWTEENGVQANCPDGRYRDKDGR